VCTVCYDVLVEGTPPGLVAVDCLRKNVDETRLSRNWKETMILFKWAFCKVCLEMRRFKKDNDKIWYCTHCGSDL
jgi:ribosomal protein L37AE/L43A